MSYRMPPQGVAFPVRKTQGTHHIVSVPTEGQLEGTILSKTWLPVLTHWDRTVGRNGQNVPCLGENDCRFHRPPDMQEPRYNGYVAFRLYDRLSKELHFRVLALPLGICNDMLNYADDENGLRGLQVCLERRKPPKAKAKKCNDPVHLLHTPRRTANPSPDFDPEPHLLRLWGVRELYPLMTAQRLVPYISQGILKWRSGPEGK